MGTGTADIFATNVNTRAFPIPANLIDVLWDFGRTRLNARSNAETMQYATRVNRNPHRGSIECAFIRDKAGGNLDFDISMRQFASKPYHLTTNGRNDSPHPVDAFPFWNQL